MSSSDLMRVGVLTGHIETPYVRALTTGMMAAARRHGAHLFIFPGLFERFYIGDMRQVDDRPENFMYSQIYDFAFRQRLDRLIVTQHAQAGPAEPAGLVERLVDQIRVPTLFLETDAGPSLHQDDYRGMALVVEHLITAHGFRRIAYIGGDPAFPSARLRHTAFLDTMKRHGIAVDESLVQAIDFTYHAGVKGTKLLLEQDEMPEAICCASDWTAIGCQQTLRDKGLIPGKDIAVTGFYDLMEAGQTFPPITTVRTHVTAFGYEAVERALEMDGARDTVPGFSRMPELIVRGSCGCHKKAPVFVMEPETFSQKPPREIEAEWTDGLLKEIAAGTGSDLEQARLRRGVQELVRVISTLVWGEPEAHSRERIRQAFADISGADLAHDLTPSVLQHLQSFLMGILPVCPGEKRPGLIRFSRQLLSYAINTYEAGIYGSTERQKKRLRLISAIARDVLQQDNKEARLWHKLFFSSRNLRLGNLWIFAFSSAQKIDPERGGKIPWDDLTLVGCQDERRIEIPETRERTAVLPERFLQGEPRCLVFLSLFANLEMYGVIAFESPQENWPTLLAITMQASTSLQYIFLEQEQKRLIRILNDQNAHYARKASSDELTGLLNRYGFIQFAQKSIRENQGRPAVLAFCDLDHLKHINDQFGHSAGDTAITAAADILRQSFGSAAIIGRVGGDEFVVFTVIAPSSSTRGLTERVRELAAVYNGQSGKPYYVEISTGATEFVCGEAVDISKLLETADDCLYEAKQHRRTTSVRAVEES